MKKPNILKKASAAFMAAVLTLSGMAGMLPTEVSAASYSVHTSADLTNTANQQEADNAALIGNLSKFRVDLTNGNFIVGEEPWAAGQNVRKTVMIPVSKIPQSATETKTFEDVCKIRYTDAGRLPDGTKFDLEYTLKKVTLKGITNTYNSDLEYLEVAAGSVDGVLSGCYAHKSDYSIFSAITPYGKNEWTVKVIPKNGSIEGAFKLPQLFEDIDIVTSNTNPPYAESLELVSGFGSNTWVQSGTTLEISNSGSRYTATVAGVNVPSHDPSVAFLAIANNTEFKLNWYGLGCRTYITPKSALGVYSSVTKSVKEKLVNIGSSVHYSIVADTSYTNELTKRKVVKVIDVLDKVLDAETAKVTVLNPKGVDKTAYWTVERNGQQLIIQPKTPADMKGAYTVNITAKVREDADFTGYKSRQEGETTYYTVPNTARLCIKYEFGLFTDDKSNEVTFEVPVTNHQPVSAIALEKDVDQKKLVGAKAGDPLAYTFKITNTGESVLSNVHIDDDLKDISKIEYDWSGVKSKTNVMEPGEVATATATYSITQDDIDNGQVINNAIVTGTDDKNVDVTDDDDAETVIEEDPSIKIEKTVDKTEIDNAKAGDQVTYTFTATNTGNVTLTKCKFADDLAIESLKWESKLGTMAPGQVIKGTATYTLTQADIDAGKVYNHCTIEGTSPAKKKVTDEDDVTTTINTGDSSIKHTKSTEKAVLDVEESVVGHVVPFDFTIENVSNVTLKNVRLEDHLENVYDVVIDWSGAKTEGSLLPGESVTATASYKLTQADIDAGKVVNTSTAYGTDPQGNEVSDDAEATVEITKKKASGIALEKDVDQKKVVGAKAGDTLAYTFTITNTEESVLSNVHIDDALEGISEINYDWSSVKSGTNVMEPGEVATATATYQLTQADIDARSVVNTALVTGTDEYGEDVTDDAEVETVIEEDPSIMIEKTVDKTNIDNAKAGDKVTYTFKATNTGNVTLTNCQFTDTLPIEGLEWDSSEIATMAPGQVINGTATYTLTQTDIDDGKVVNNCTIEGTSPAGSKVTDEDDAETVINTGIPSIKHTKSTEKAVLDVEESVAGHVVPFDFTIENSCGVTLADIRLEDHLEGIYDVVIDWTGAATEGVLLPGEVVTAKAFYQLTQDDIEAGSVVNTSTAYGTDPQGTEVSADASATVKITNKPSIDLEKTVDESKLLDQEPQTVEDEAQTGDVAVNESIIQNAYVGMVIPYKFVGTNTGNKKLINVEIIDNKEGLSEITYEWPGEAGVLEPGQVVTASATYTLTQEDLDAASVKNEAVIKGVTLTGDPVEDPGDTDNPIPQHPGISVVKETEVTQLKDAVAGKTVIPYTFVIANTGDVTLHDVAATDDHDIPDLTWEKDISELKVGESVRGTGSYTVTQEDIAAGHVLNTVFVTGKSPEDVEVTDDDDANTDIEKYASLTLEKAADKKKIPDAKPGDLISYEMKSTNNGNLVIKDIVFSDSLTGKGLSELNFTWPGEEGKLLPGETLVVTATYTVTQEDINVGYVINTAHIEGTPDDPEDPGDPIVPEDPTVTTELEQKPSITVIKTVDKTELKDPKVGQELNYGFVATNTGNVPLTMVEFIDELEGISALDIQWPGEEGKLLPGESATATAKYAITQADIDAGIVPNHVIVTAKDPKDQPVEDDDNVKTEITGTPKFEVSKTADKLVIKNAKEGDVITYTITGKNTGNTTLINCYFEEQLEGVSDLVYTWPNKDAEGTLLPGETVTATGTYKLTAADIKKGSVTNVVLMHATTPDGKTPEPKKGTVTTKVEVPATPTPKQPTPTPTPKTPTTTTTNRTTPTTSTTTTTTTTTAQTTKTGDYGPVAGIVFLVAAVAILGVYGIKRRKQVK